MTDDRLEQIVGNLLRAGVTLAAAVVLAGGIWYLAQNSAGRPDFHVFRPESWQFSAALSPRWLIELGLVILVATPVGRVSFSVVAFVLERDWTYVLISLAVLMVLLYSLVPL